MCAIADHGDRTAVFTLIHRRQQAVGDTYTVSEPVMTKEECSWHRMVRVQKLDFAS